MMRQSSYTLPLFLEPDGTGGYVVTSPLLPGLVTEGDNHSEAIQHAKDAAESLLAAMLEDGDPLPVELSRYLLGDELAILVVNHQ